MAKAAPKKREKKAELVAKIAKALGIPAAQVEMRALRELARSVGLEQPASPRPPKEARPASSPAPKETKPPPAPKETKPPPAPKETKPPPAPKETKPAEPHALPQRLFLALDGRGLDGRGMPLEVIHLPCIVGSGKQCNVWINAPRIETRHLQITQSGEGWLLEDLGTEHGTFLGDERIKRRIIQNGDEYRLAGYLRLRTELR